MNGECSQIILCQLPGHVSRQSAPGFGFDRKSHGLIDQRVAFQRGLDLAGFQAHAVDLGLIVGAAQHLDHPIGAQTGDIAGGVFATHGALGKPLRAPQIARRDLRAAEHQFPRAPDRAGMAVAVADHGTCIGRRAAQVHRHTRLHLGGKAEGGAFAGAVEIQ